MLEETERLLKKTGIQISEKGVRRMIGKSIAAVEKKMAIKKKKYRKKKNPSLQPRRKRDVQNDGGGG